MSFSLNCCTNCWRLLMFLLRSARLGGKKGQRAAPRVDRRDRSRLLNPGVPFCKAWKSFASIASLSWMDFRADIVPCVTFHACDAREVSGERARLPQRKHALSQRGRFISNSQVSADEQTKHQLLLVSHTPRAAFARWHARARGEMFYSVALLSPKGALGQIWVRRTRTTRVAPASRARFPLSPLVLVLLRTRLTSPPRHAFADPGAPAEPRGSPEPAHIRQALRGGRVRHHHEATLSAGSSSPTRRKTSLRYDPETSRGSPRARTHDAR